MMISQRRSNVIRPERFKVAGELPAAIASANDQRNVHLTSIIPWPTVKCIPLVSAAPSASSTLRTTSMAAPVGVRDFAYAKASASSISQRIRFSNK